MDGRVCRTSLVTYTLSLIYHIHLNVHTITYLRDSNRGGRITQKVEENHLKIGQSSAAPTFHTYTLQPSWHQGVTAAAVQIFAIFRSIRPRRGRALHSVISGYSDPFSSFRPNRSCWAGDHRQAGGGARLGQKGKMAPTRKPGLGTYKIGWVTFMESMKIC